MNENSPTTSSSELNKNLITGAIAGGMAGLVARYDGTRLVLSDPQTMSSVQDQVSLLRDEEARLATLERFRDDPVGRTIDDPDFTDVPLTPPV